MTTEIDIKSLAIKHGFKDESYRYSFELAELQAFANEYMALSSSEPVAVLHRERIEVYSPRLTVHQRADIDFLNVIESDRESELRYIALSDGDYNLYLANPINQQLQTERDECVEEIRRLRKALDKIYMLTGCSASEHLEAMRNIYSSSKNALKAPASILKLLEK